MFTNTKSCKTFSVLMVVLLPFYFVVSEIIRNFAARTKHVRIMTTLQMNAELFRAMSEIADDETMMAKVLKYVKKLAAKKTDPTLMTKEEFFDKLDEAEREIAEGKGIKMLPNESLDEFLRRVG